MRSFCYHGFIDEKGRELEKITIYRIVNTVNGKCYVGQTRNMRVRIMAHFSSLKSGLHSSHKFRQAYKEYGETAFVVEVLEEGVSIEDADMAEMWWIVFFNSHFDGYNGTPGNRHSRWGIMGKASYK